MGYSIFPIMVVAIVLACVGVAWRTAVWFRATLVLPACAWAVWASFGLMKESVRPKRKLLAVYPLFLFYIVLAWMAIISS